MKTNKWLLTSSIALALSGSNVTEAAIELQADQQWLKDQNITTSANQDIVAYYIRYKKNTNRANLTSVLEANNIKVDHDLSAYNTLAVSLPAGEVDALRNISQIEFMEPVPEHQILAQVTPWNIDQFQARDVWDADRDGIVDPNAPTGAGVKFCIIDTGFYAAHDDFQGITHTGMSQISGEAYTEDGNGHGTHVAGTANAVNNDIGVVGVMPGGAELHIIKIFNNSGVWSPGESNLGAAAIACKDAGANAISMSLGGGSSATEEAIFQDLYDNFNVINIAAAGNDGNATASYPASYDSVISVAALRESDNVADFSQYPATANDPNNPPANVEWDVVELSGGGENVLSTWPGPPHGNVPVYQVTNDGTNYSATQVAETAAGDVTQTLVDGGLCDAGDISPTWSGNVVLCERGAIPFSDKMNNVADNSGVAVVLFNNVAGALNATCGGNCTSGATIPGVAITQAEGQFLETNGLGLDTRVLADDGTGCVGCSGGYNAISGTSMATPGVAAGIAWAWSACGGPTGITNKELRQLLRDSARDLSGTHDQSGTPYGAGWDPHTGFGLVQLKDALELGNQQFGSTCPIGLSIAPAEATVCTLPTAPDVDFTLTLDDAFLGTSDLTSSGVPAGATGNWSVNPVVHPTDTSVFTVGQLTGQASGTYDITLTATDQADINNTASGLVALNLVDDVPGSVNLTSPLNGATGVASLPTLSWSSSSQAVSYDVELLQAGNLVESDTGLTGNSYTVANSLQSNTTYTWRVTAYNACGDTVSTEYSFTTGTEVCEVFTSTDVPVTIPATAPPNVNPSNLTINTVGTIADVNVVDLSGTHSWINDLIISVESPNNISVTLLDSVCFNEDDFDLNFDDQAAAGALPCPPVGGGDYQPQGSLASFYGENMEGNWTLTVEDTANVDGGELQSWGLEICYSPGTATDFTVGGTVSNLNGSVTLQNNGNGIEDLTLSADGSFAFSPQPKGSQYNIAVINQPAAQICTVSNGSGIIVGTNVTNVMVDCLDNFSTAVDDNATVLEDVQDVNIDILANDSDSVNGANIDSVTQPLNGAVVIVGGGTGVEYSPAADYCGADTFTYTLKGGSTADVNVTVGCVNDAPDFAANDILYMSPADTDPRMVACSMTMGPANESGQGVQAFTVNIDSDPNGVLSTAAVDNAGMFTGTMSGNMGSATISITLQDDGGVANGGEDTSVSRQAVIDVQDYIFKTTFDMTACQ